MPPAWIVASCMASRKAARWPCCSPPRYPERVAGLILHATAARLIPVDETIRDRDARRDFLEQWVRGWGTEESTTLEHLRPDGCCRRHLPGLGAPLRAPVGEPGGDARSDRDVGRHRRSRGPADVDGPDARTESSGRSDGAGRPGARNGGGDPWCSVRRARRIRPLRPHRRRRPVARRDRAVHHGRSNRSSHHGPPAGRYDAHRDPHVRWVRRPLATATMSHCQRGARVGPASCASVSPLPAVSPCPAMSCSSCSGRTTPIRPSSEPDCPCNSQSCDGSSVAASSPIGTRSDSISTAFRSTSTQFRAADQSWPPRRGRRHLPRAVPARRPLRAVGRRATKPLTSRLRQCARHARRRGRRTRRPHCGDRSRRTAPRGRSLQQRRPSPPHLGTRPTPANMAPRDRPATATPTTCANSASPTRNAFIAGIEAEIAQPA